MGHAEAGVAAWDGQGRVGVVGDPPAGHSAFERVGEPDERVRGTGISCPGGHQTPRTTSRSNALAAAPGECPIALPISCGVNSGCAARCAAILICRSPWDVDDRLGVMEKARACFSQQGAELLPAVAAGERLVWNRLAEKFA